MTERLYGISYAFSPLQDTDTISTEGFVTYSPTAVCYDDRDHRHLELKFPKDFRAYPRKGDLYPSSKSYYNKLGMTARENQERLIADFICAIILKQLRAFPDDRFIFVIKDAFETEKFVGRLGYLGLPLDKIAIYFISSNLKDLLTNYLSPFSQERIGDLSRLKGGTDGLFGPFPEDEEATMLRTFFWAFSNPELYPLRINLFSQFMNRPMLDRECKRIERLFGSQNWAELYAVDGGRGQEKTRLPKVLIECEDYIRRKITAQSSREQEGR